MTYTIAALYRFVELTDLPSLKSQLLHDFKALDLCGTLLLAPEGLNGTLAGSPESIDAMLGILRDIAGLPREDVKFSYAGKKPFQRLKVRLKREIITFKQLTANPSKLAGTYVAPKEWNELIKDPDVVVLDTRNDYETVIGTFAGAKVPPIKNFTEFAAFVRTKMNSDKQKKIAMFCTGGIRCEKASAFMRAEGFQEVYHLKGGILKYLEEIPADESQWNGECYVFDRRVSVGHGLKTGPYAMCYNCGNPISPDDKKHPDFEQGVTCARCCAATTEEDKTRFRMRQQQIDLNAPAEPSLGQ